MVAQSQVASSILEYHRSLGCCYPHQFQPQQHQQPRRWDVNPQTATSQHRKFYSVDAMLNRGGSDPWRTQQESVSSVELSDLSGELRRFDSVIMMIMRMIMGD